MDITRFKKHLQGLFLEGHLLQLQIQRVIEEVNKIDTSIRFWTN